MKLWRVVFTVEHESFIDADTEDEAVLMAREGLVGLEDGMVVVAEEVSEWSESHESDPG